MILSWPLKQQHSGPPETRNNPSNQEKKKDTDEILNLTVQKMNLSQTDTDTMVDPKTHFGRYEMDSIGAKPQT